MLSYSTSSSTYIMHLLNPFHRYSDLLKSGFLSFTNRARKQSSEIAPHAMLDTPHLTPKTSFSDTTTTGRRPRSVSVPDTAREKAERRRSSTSLSHLFDHKSTPNFSSDSESSRIFFRNSTCSVDSRDSGIWIAEDGLYTVPSINESSDDGSCDPFSSASDAKSVFLDFLLQDDSALDTPKHDSFLSFTPSNRSSILFDRVRTSSN